MVDKRLQEFERTAKQSRMFKMGQQYTKTEHVTPNASLSRTGMEHALTNQKRNLIYKNLNKDRASLRDIEKNIKGR